MFCKYCGAEIPEDSIFCEKCGRKQAPETESAPVAEPVPVAEPKPRRERAPMPAWLGVALGAALLAAWGAAGGWYEGWNSSGGWQVVDICVTLHAAAVVAAIGLLVWAARRERDGSASRWLLRGLGAGAVCFAAALLTTHGTDAIEWLAVGLLDYRQVTAVVRVGHVVLAAATAAGAVWCAARICGLGRKKGR